MRDHLDAAVGKTLYALLLVVDWAHRHLTAAWRSWQARRYSR